MICPDLETFFAALPSTGAIAALDLGTKTIGVAISDHLRGIGTPFETIRRKKFGIDATRLLEIAQTRGVCGFVLGLPLNMDGSEGPRCQATRAFARNFAGVTALPISFQDERLSTVAAERVLIAADTSRKRRSEVIDHVAAGVILQAALDRKNHFGASDNG